MPITALHGNFPAGVTGIDFETFCELDIREVGMHKYVEHHSFTPLLVGIARPDLSAVRPYGDWYDLMDETSYNAFFAFMRSVRIVIGHNVDFEKKVLEKMGIDVTHIAFIDSAVDARGMGGSSSLENSVSQFLPGRQKMTEGRRLIRKYSVPPANPKLIDRSDLDWKLFGEYAKEDAILGLELTLLADADENYAADITRDMNFRGWHVDIDMVKEMQRRFEENTEAAMIAIKQIPGAEDLNPNSHIQLQKWCRERGVNATSFSEASVKSMLVKIGDRLTNGQNVTEAQREGYTQVMELLQLKQIIGGSSLKKLQRILDMTSDDGRLRGQYMHLGAQQTFRTSGSGVQMQNLKRLHNPINMEKLYDPTFQVTNDELAENLRQVFTATHPEGKLIVGDFSSVESRGLAYLAGAQWKLDAYRQGKDMYKVLADKKFQVGYDNINKDQRTFGKVGELSCGYGAGGSAVRSFADGMGVKLTVEEAQNLVDDWRAVNPEVVDFWRLLDEMLKEAFRYPTAKLIRQLANPELSIEMGWRVSPMSLQDLMAGAKSLYVTLSYGRGRVMTRVFHGLHQYGRDYRYYKPCDTQKADWVNFSINPTTGERRYFTLYGGKLAGILTQSLCREIFFECLGSVFEYTTDEPFVDLIGQFHDEIVLEWTPSDDGPSLEEAVSALGSLMTETAFLEFPLAAEVKYDYRYTK